MEPVTAEMSEMLFFEIPAYADVEQFCARIRPRWPGWKMLDVDVWLVGATVKVDDTDLAVLLRAVGDAITELGCWRSAIAWTVASTSWVDALSRARRKPRPRFRISRPCNRQNDQISGTSSTATAANRISNGSPSFQ